MAARDPPRGRPGGGGSIQAARQVRARVATAVAAVLAALGVGAAVVVRADTYELYLLVLCGVAALVLALALAAGWTSLLPWPLVLLGGGYAWSLGGGDVDQWAPVYAAGLLVVAELGYWSLELRGRVQGGERINERRAGLIVALGLGTVAVGGIVMSATSLPIGSGVALDGVGALAAVGAVAAIAAIARSHRRA